MTSIKIGDRVKTPDGKTITVHGVLQVDGTAHRASECQPVDHHAHEASGGAGTQAATKSAGDAIVWGT